MKKLIITATTLVALFSTANAQYRTELIYREGYNVCVTNPIGWYFNKVGAGVEYYKDRNGYVATATKYLGFYPGVQVGGEYRYNTHIGRKSETYIYAKVLAGSVHYYNYGQTLSGPLMKSSPDHTEHGELAFNLVPNDYRSQTYFYGGAGGGVGKQIKLGDRIFAAGNIGFKYTPVINLKKDDKEDFKGFHYVGPGSYLDLNFTIGYKF